MTPEEVRKYLKLHLSNTYGMTVTKEQKEKILEIYKEGRQGLVYKDTDSIEECLKIAIDSVSKYQNIEQILDNWNAFKYDDNEALRLISEVVYKD